MSHLAVCVISVLLVGPYVKVAYSTASVYPVHGGRNPRSASY